MSSSQDHDQARIGALEKMAHAAIARWNLPVQTPELLKYRENAVYRVRLADGAPAALRLHRPGYHDAKTIYSELEFSAHLASNGLKVPLPIAAEDGAILIDIGAHCGAPSHFASLVSWMEGEPLGQSGQPLARDQSKLAGIFLQLGRVMGQLHDFADRFQPDQNFRRPSWNAEGLIGERPLWGRFWDCPGLDPGQAKKLLSLRHDLGERMVSSEFNALDFGLIHADAVRENVMLAGRDVGLIDFDDSGYGYRLFDIATVLLKNCGEPCYLQIKDALIEGYRSQRVLPNSALSCLPEFMVLRALTYVGWAAERPEVVHKVSSYATAAIELAEAL
jgi:Ser/Thr protein kinase RdoA (MazF antagonist)